MPVRVIRGHDCKSSYSKRVYTYDGLYTVLVHIYIPLLFVLEFLFICNVILKVTLVLSSYLLRVGCKVLGRERRFRIYGVQISVETKGGTTRTNY